MSDEINRRRFIREGLICLSASLFSLNNIYSSLDARQPPAKKNNTTGNLCVVLDDAGGSKNNSTLLKKLQKDNVPITIAVVPKSMYEHEILDILAEYANADILLHQPMEPQRMEARRLSKGVELSPRKRSDAYDVKKHAAIYDQDSNELIKTILSNNVAEINDYLQKRKPKRRIVGINNHMGSLVTKNPRITEAIAEYCKENNLILLDSKTTPDSVMYDAGKKACAAAYQDALPFLDNPAKNKYVVSARLKAAYDEAQKKKIDIIKIGHIEYDATVESVIEFYRKNKRLARISNLASQ